MRQLWPAYEVPRRSRSGFAGTGGPKIQLAAQGLGGSTPPTSAASGRAATDSADTDPADKGPAAADSPAAKGLAIADSFAAKGHAPS